MQIKNQNKPAFKKVWNYVKKLEIVVAWNNNWRKNNDNIDNNKTQQQ